MKSMKYKNYKKSVLMLAGLYLLGSLWAQNNQNIELPEVTTVISGESEKAGADPCPHGQGNGQERVSGDGHDRAYGAAQSIASVGGQITDIQNAEAQKE